MNRYPELFVLEGAQPTVCALTTALLVAHISCDGRFRELMYDPEVTIALSFVPHKTGLLSEEQLTRVWENVFWCMRKAAIAKGYIAKPVLH